MRMSFWPFHRRRTERGHGGGAWLCKYPFRDIEIDVDGRYSACCVAKPFAYTVGDKTIKEHFNSAEMQALRAGMIDRPGAGRR